MNNIFSYGNAVRSPLANTVTNSYQKRIAGNNPVLQNKFLQGDEATAAAAGNMRQQSAQPSVFGQGAAGRGAMATESAIGKMVGANKLGQAGEAASDIQTATAGAQGWQTSLDSSDRANRQQDIGIAEGIGDNTTLAGMLQHGTANQGLSLTGYGQGKMQEQADTAAMDAKTQRQREEELYQLQRRQLDRSLQGGDDSTIGKLLQGAGSLAKSAAPLLSLL